MIIVPRLWSSLEIEKGIPVEVRFQNVRAPLLRGSTVEKSLEELISTDSQG